jgi:hypothetical protein
MGLAWRAYSLLRGVEQGKGENAMLVTYELVVENSIQAFVAYVIAPFCPETNFVVVSHLAES